MTITSHLFEAHLKCPTKCWLRSTGEPTAGNAYAEWVQTKKESYRAEAAKWLTTLAPADECAVVPTAENLKTGRWRFAVDVPVRVKSRSSRGNEALTEKSEIEMSLLTSAATNDEGQIAESRLHAVERVPSEGRGKAAQFIPIRFIFTNKLSKDDKLLLAFDAFVLSETLGREVRLGRIIHGDDRATLKVKTSALVGEVRKRIEKIVALLSSPTPPDLVLNRHCAECEFQARCRKKALEQDDLSLLARMNEKERKELRSKGIFTVTQLSYTFRPRRRPKRMRDKREKYHHSLKALAIREKKIHIVGSPELKIEGTPIYLDVEGLPDRDFYYLIGLRIGHGESAVQHSLWADTVEDEGKIWREFLAILETVEKPVLIHYGSYETDFLRLLSERHGRPPENSRVVRAIETSVNVLSALFAHIYFPTSTNGLKDVAGFLGFKWSEAGASGLRTIMWRQTWENFPSHDLQEKLRNYNSEDCQALQIITQAMRRLGEPEIPGTQSEAPSTAVVHTELLPHQTMWPRFRSPFVEFEEINRAARWDYQRERVYVRSSNRIHRISRREHARRIQHLKMQRLPIAKVIKYPECNLCPTCNAKGFRHLNVTKRVLYDIHIGRANLRRRVVEYHYREFWCPACRMRFGAPSVFWSESKFGRGFVAYLLYHVIELRIPMAIVRESVNRLLRLNLTEGIVGQFKVRGAKYYADTHRAILNRLATGDLVHADETRVNIRGTVAYVWVMTNLHEVAYVYSDTRDGEVVKTLLAGFKGVLVSDFYTAYDSIQCPQQRCLLHLIRDLNAEILAQPYDEDVKQIVKFFAELLKPMIETVDRNGLKAHYLRKHRASVETFYRWLEKASCQSEAAIKCRQRFEKNKGRLFTFLEFDGVPWNNNNAEHAIKAFAGLRDVVGGSWTAKSVQEHLTLLSVCQTCKYMGVDFLDFLRSGEKDIHAFAESRRGRRRQTQTSQPANLPANVIPDSGGQR